MQHVHRGDDERRDERFRPEVDLELVASDGAVVPIRLINISRNGFSARHASPIGPGHEVQLRLHDATSRTAKVIWVTHDVIGCELASPLDDDLLGRIGGETRDMKLSAEQPSVG